jgi:DNA-binding GntR family transcriptional regulator
MKTMPAPIPRQSLSSAVAERVRDKIVRGEYREGEQLPQDAIAVGFGVSRIPVREALRQLEAEGLIKIIAHRGAMVSALSPDEIGELFEIRALLEGEVLRLSISGLTEADFQKAESILSTIDKALKDEENVGVWGRLNSQFHSALYSRANRPHFMNLIQMINNNGDRYTCLQLYLTRAFERASEEHHKILSFCRKREVSAACELLDRHIRHAGQGLKEFLTHQRRFGSAIPHTAKTSYPPQTV